MFRDAGCQRCELSKACKTVCISSEWYGHVGHWPSKDSRKFPRAILVVGEAPGATEDQMGRNFVGKAGKHLRNAYLDFFKFAERADVFIANSVRCRPPGNKTPKKKHLKSCQGFLIRDLQALQSTYDEVIVLAVGGTAVLSTTGESLGARLKKQGQPSDFRAIQTKPTFTELTEAGTPVGFPSDVKVFVTYHPAYLMRNPAAGLAVLSHLRLLSNHLDGKTEIQIKPKELQIGRASPPPKYPIRRLSLDIETYGFFRDGPYQTQYHPLKMEVYDYVPKDKIIRITGLTHRAPGGGLVHTVFNMESPAERRVLWGWFDHIRKHHQDFEFMLGQNLAFDLLCLRHCWPESQAWLNHRLPIWDTLVTNYLHDEGKPEKSMKALGPLLGITEYEEKPIKAFDNANDPASHQYVCQDTATTFLVQERLEQDIRTFYGAGSKKLSPFCYQWYSELLWLIIWMTETGVCMDVPHLQRIFDRLVARRDVILKVAKDQWDMPFRGKGSQIAMRSALDEAVSLLKEKNLPVPDLELTEVTKEVSFKVENRNKLLETFRGSALRSSPPSKKLRLIGRYQDVSKLLDTYLYPLLVGRGKKHDDISTRILDRVAYPKWYPVPSEFDDTSTGGTKQARIVCKGPPIQTFPALLGKGDSVGFSSGCITTRYDGIIWFDYSQIELRVAALLSNDPAMCSEYQKGKPDLHGNTAKLMFGDDYNQETKSPDKYRQAGKTFNFRGLFRGGAEKAQATLMQDLGIWLPITRIHEIDNGFWSRHKRLWEWQEEIIAFARKHDYFELPLIGQSRLYLGGKKAKDKAMNEMVNQPVQSIAADITLSAQYALWRAFKEAKLRSVVPLNIYDAGAIEAIWTERHAIRMLMEKVLPNPPFYQALCAELGRTLPLSYDVKEKWKK